MADGHPGPTVIALPEPCLVALVGAAGSGKSTLAGRLFGPDEVLSSDAHRSLVSGDESDQGATLAAFRRLHSELHRRLAEGRTTVVDATSVTPFARRALVRIATRHGVAAVAIVLDLPADVVLARNAGRRGRVVPDAVVRRQLADLARSLRGRGLAAEGFVAVHRLLTPAAIDAAAITRGRALLG